MERNNFSSSLAYFTDKLQNRPLFELEGKISRIIGVTIESIGPSVALGDLCRIKLKDGSKIFAETVGFSDNRVLLMPLEDVRGIHVGGHKLISLLVFKEVIIIHAKGKSITIAPPANSK